MQWLSKARVVYFVRGVGDGGEATGGVARRSEEGRDETSGSTEVRSEHEGASLPIDGGIVTTQPREAQGGSGPGSQAER